ncbi:MAG: hypothetical protein D6703_04855 [Zetaproteobacteria bacterium]|nr:MAG: hypothetical protein D6703_04855 [Zetaproteobacteria bacterium]
MSLASRTPVSIRETDFLQMLQFARAIQSLQYNACYANLLEDELPPTARLIPDWPAMLMGFDFHLTPHGPRLIEINNNAGGLFVGASSSREGPWIPQPPHEELRGSLEQRLLGMFAPAWHTIVIMDENVREQFMFPEMEAYARLLNEHGRRCWVASPEELALTDSALSFRGKHVDAIYNRHTDFYLQTPELAHVRRAFLTGTVDLNPYPRSYALVGDKRRMVDWWREGWLEQCVSPETVSLVRGLTPETHRLDEVDAQWAWQHRKSLVFKPAARHGGKGVLLGRSISRKRFELLNPQETIVQQFVPPSQVELEGRRLKLDVRLFMHGSNLIAIAGRVWLGQVTNFRQPGTGWVALSVDAE